MGSLASTICHIEEGWSLDIHGMSTNITANVHVGNSLFADIKVDMGFVEYFIHIVLLAPVEGLFDRLQSQRSVLFGHIQVSLGNTI